jgi:hypothetical protein
VVGVNTYHFTSHDDLVAGGKEVRFDPRRDWRGMKEWIAVRAGGADWVQLAKEAYKFVKRGKS